MQSGGVRTRWTVRVWKRQKSIPNAEFALCTGEIHFARSVRKGFHLLNQEEKNKLENKVPGTVFHRRSAIFPTKPSQKGSNRRQ
jgi:hypothetical protein